MFLCCSVTLNVLSSIYRPMTPAEKRKLRKLIQALPPQHLDHVVEIIQRSKPAETKSCDEICVELEKEVKKQTFMLLCA